MPAAPERAPAAAAVAPSTRPPRVSRRAAPDPRLRRRRHAVGEQRAVRARGARLPRMARPPHPRPRALREVLDDVERATIAVHGYGSASFLHSLHVCFERLRERPATDAERAEITRLAAALVDHDVELMPGVADALAQLATRHDLLLLTKGQTAEQQRKIDASGLAHHFRSTHIVAEKAPATYRELVGSNASPRRDLDDRQLAPLGHPRRPRRGAARGVHPAPLHVVARGAGDRPGRPGSAAPGAVPRPARTTSDRRPAGRLSDVHDADVDWAGRAAVAEQAVVRRHLRPHRRRAPRHPHRPGALAATAARAAVPVALLVAGAPAGLPRRRPAARPAPAPRGHHRHAHPQRPAAQRRAAGPTRSTTTSPGSASPSSGRARWRRDNRGAGGGHPAAAPRVDRRRRGRHLVAARRGRGRPGQERARQRARRDPAGPRRPDRVRRRDHRLGGRDARRPRHRARPRRGAAGPRRLGLRGRPPHLHLLPGRAPRRVRRARRPRRPPALGATARWRSSTR